MALFSDPVLLGAVGAGLAFLVALKVAAFLVVRKVMRAPPRNGDEGKDGPPDAV